MASSQQDDLRAMDVHEAIRHHDQSAIWLACLRSDDGLEFSLVVNSCSDRLQAEGRSGGFEWAQVNVGDMASLPD